MRIVRVILWMSIAMLVLQFGYVVATQLEGVEVTAPGLARVATIVMTLKIFDVAIRGFLRDHRSHVASVEAARARMPIASMRPTSNQQEIKRSLETRARHEAAHAVVAHVLGHLVVSASIAPLGSSGGRVAWQHKTNSLASVDHIAIGFAGPLAEGTGDVLPGHLRHDDDYSKLLHMSMAASVTDPAARTPTQILDEGTAVARRLIAEHATAIDVLTKALLTTDEERDLDEHEIQRLLDEHFAGPAS